jgi:Calcineurin-like phosphoesterase
MRLTARVWLAATAWLVCGCLPPSPVRAEAPPAAGKLQLYVMPDTQSWAANQDGTTLATWRAVVEALCRQRQRFAMVLHTGDMVDTPRVRPEQWSNALSVMRLLDACRMPYAIAFGNHDYDDYPSPKGDLRGIGDRGWTGLVTTLAHQPVERSPSGRSGVYPLAPGWFVVAVEFRPTEADQAWLSAAIGARRGAKFVWLHHDCVNRRGVAFEFCTKLFERHPEIRVAISGHWLGTTRDGWRQVPRANGHDLVALYQNYQHVPALASWGVVVELDPASGALCVWSEDVLSGAVTHPAVSSSAVGSVEAGIARTCFDGS